MTNINHSEIARDIVSKMSLETKASLLCGGSFFASRGSEEFNVPPIKMLDGGTGINFEQLFGDMYRDDAIKNGYSDTEFDNVIRNFYKVDNLTEKEQRLRDQIFSELTKYCDFNIPSPGCYPPGISLASTWDREVIKNVGKALSLESCLYGQSLLLGTPNINILRDVRNGRYFEGYSEDPYLTGELAAEFVKGVKEYNVATNIKHFAANNLEINRIGINETISERALREIYFPAFKKCVEAGADSVMVAYPSINGKKCTENSWLLRDVLRDEWGFDGLTLTDWGACTGLESDSVAAGVNLIMPGPWSYDDIVNKVNDGSLDISVVDEAATNVVAAAIKFYKKPGLPEGISYEDYLEIGDKAAYDAAASGIVMLKSSISFPVSEDSKFIIFGNDTGELLDYGGGSAQVFTDRKYSLKDYLGDVSFNDYDAYSTSKKPVAIVICSIDSCEGSDRTDIHLPQETVEILNELANLTNFENQGKIALILNTPSPVDLRDVICIPNTIFYVSYPGMMGAKALADILVGKVNPSGKLSVTYPERLEDIPSYLNYPDSFSCVYGEDIYVGYRGYEKRKIMPLFPFGYGESYTTFDLDNIETDKSEYSKDETVHITFDVINTGERDGATVVQVYVGDRFSRKSKPIKELKAFGKYFLKAGESKKCELKINISDLASFDEDYSKFLVEDGIYDIRIGFDSRDNYHAEIRVTDGDEEYRFGINSTVKEIIEVPSLYKALCDNIDKLNMDPHVLVSNIRYTPFKKICEIYKNSTELTDFISSCNQYSKD